jgi:ATP-dependent Clp protease ATP-binding subunit ClpX
MVEHATSEAAAFARYPGWCSFCRKHYKEVGPLAEGPDQVFICLHCCRLCAFMIEGEYGRLGIEIPKPLQ